MENVVRDDVRSRIRSGRARPAGSGTASWPTTRAVAAVPCLGIVVLATIVLYYQFYLAGASPPADGERILVDYHMSFVYYVNIGVVGYILGAAASFVAGIADRYGREIVTVGLLIAGAALPDRHPVAHSKLASASSSSPSDSSRA